MASEFAQPVVGRRWVLARAGRGVLGFAILGLAACTGSGDGGTAATPTSAAPDASPTPTGAPTATDQPQTTLAWSRVDLGFVAAYVLVRGAEAAVVDTGVGGSAGAIAAVLADAGPGWAGVRHVVLTHRHPDHVGSVGEVLAAAPGATGYVGRADLPAVAAPRELTPLGDGDEVFGLRIVATPGHTAGHVAVFDPGTAVLVAGDALSNQGGLAGSNPQFTDDATAAAESVRTLAALQPRTILVGHGPPVTEDAAGALDRLAASL
jgi:glyoxylase-like metal-dependent hydrolase (beta-lactamase superfamily II)